LFKHPILVGQSETPDQIEQLKQRFEASLDILENVWLAHDGHFLTGEQITIADVMAACEIEQPSMKA
jgi:glutathione S-transferase